MTNQILVDMIELCPFNFNVIITSILKEKEIRDALLGKLRLNFDIRQQYVSICLDNSPSYNEYIVRLLFGDS